MMDKKRIVPFLIMFVLPLAAINLEMGKADRIYVATRLIAPFLLCVFLHIRKKRDRKELLLQIAGMLMLGIIGLWLRGRDTAINLMSCHAILYLIWLEWWR